MGIDLDRGMRTQEDASLPVDGDCITAERVTARELLNWGAARIYKDTNGRLNWRWVVNTAGVMPVTEASGVAISTATGRTQIAVSEALPSISAYHEHNLGMDQRRIGRATATTAAGAFANLSLVPALAGYYGVCKIVGVVAVNAAAGASLTFESPAATPALPSVFVNTYAANVINKDLEDVVISHATLVDNQAIVVDGAGFGAGDVVILYEYWYET